MNRGGNVTIVQLQPIAATIGIPLIGEAGGVQRAVKPIAAAV